jgi:hypothetical protein
MENWSSHIINDVIRLLTEGQVHVIIFAPHTTQISQVFDMTLFNVFKWYLKYELAFGDEEVINKFRMKIYRDFKQITVDFNIWKALQAFWIEFDIRNDSDKLLFNEEKLRQNARFLDLWSNNFAIDHLSNQSHFTRFYWINKK